MPPHRRKLRRLSDWLLILLRPACLWAVCAGLLYAALRTNPVDLVLAIAGLFFLGPAVYATEDAILEYGFAKILDEFEDLWHDEGKGDS